MRLPKISKECVTRKLNSQLAISVFPKSEGQPDIDVVKIDFTQIDGSNIGLYLTPCEALEVAAAINECVLIYLQNQKQYRDEILKARIKLVAKREKEAAKNKKYQNRIKYGK